MSRFMKKLFFIVLLISILAAPGVYAASSPEGELVIFHAGSLSVPFAKIEKNFETLNPKVDVVRTSGGSTKMARMISDAGKPADIMASADYKVIDSELIPGHADWNIRFATNRLVLCYTGKSKHAGAINPKNWHRILREKDVVWGHSDPNLDPCGYRSLMVLQLAEKFYGKKGLYDALLANRPKENVRTKAVELVSLLKSGEMDYAWEYLSVAIQHGLSYVDLNDHINLGNYRYDPFYSQAQVKVTGKKPGTWKTKKGKSCTYGITMIKDSKNPAAAKAFMAYLLSPEGGLKILKEMGQPPFIPGRVSDEKVLSLIPGEIAPFVKVVN